MNRVSLRNQQLTFMASMLLLSATGCMWPGMYYGSPYGTQMYAPPQTLNQATPPGTLYIPESTQQYEPGKTYDTDPVDDFNKTSPNGQFFTPDDAVPQPRDLNQQKFRDDLGGPSTQLTPPPTQNIAARPPSVQLASAVSIPPEYGFDRVNYRWLRGVLHMDSVTGEWMITYSLAADDRYKGRLKLQVSDAQLQAVTAGQPVDVQGHIHENAGNQSPTYIAESIRPMAVRVAM